MAFLLRGLAFLILSVYAAGQVSGGRYEALKTALGLSDSQVKQIEAVRALRRGDFTARALHRPPSPQAHLTIDGANLPASTSDQVRDRILDDSQRAKLAVIAKVLDRTDTAALAITLGLIQAEQWPGRTLCDFYPARAYVGGVSELGLSDFQLQQFEQMRRAAVARLPRDQSWAVLDDAQKIRLAEFEATLTLAAEAIDLGLIARPPRGEPLCH